MDIRKIAQELNQAAEHYKIGQLQNIRKNIKGMKRRAGSSIFEAKSISDKGWAFHWGGRNEIQFNIGLEQEGFRYGLAFSLELSQTLPDIRVMYPKIRQFNNLVRESPSFFKDYKMWYWHDDHQRSAPSSVEEISPDRIRPGVFIFIGKLEESYRGTDEVLSIFDKLLDVYLSIESEARPNLSPEEPATEKFVFQKTQRKLPEALHYTLAERVISVDIRHSLLQKQLAEELIAEYGESNVSIEHPFNGNRIDAVVRHEKCLSFYEVKVASSLRRCIRDALGQLMEYAYWNDGTSIKELVIISEYEEDEATRRYLQYLNTVFKLPFAYRKVKL